jgi:hypothetical protein
MSSANIHLEAAKMFALSPLSKKGTEVMERRDFLKIAMGFVAGGAALAATAQAAPLPPVSGELKAAPAPAGVEPAVVSQDDVDRIKPEEVRWHHHGHWHRRWHHRRWHRRWYHRRWHHRHWRHHRHW